jgi:DNA-binding beta-propeller fold protein YncE
MMRAVVTVTTGMAALLLAAAVPGSGAGSRPTSGPASGRDVVFVANAEAGTVSAVDAASFEVLHELDVTPDGDTAELGEDDPVQATVGQRIVEAAGGENLAQDQDLSPDGRVLYVSRGHRGDVAAFDLATDALLWKTAIDGLRSDHATLSPDGARLFVSSLTTDTVQVVDTRDGTVLASFPTGEWPHDNHVSHDGERLYNASIGNITTPWEVRAARVAAPGLASPYQLRIVDAETLELQRTYEFAAGIRPFAISDDETRLYAQLSELHGVIAYDLEAGRELRRLELPIDDGATSDDYSFEAPHHGLDLHPDGDTLCLAGRASDYVALVDVETFTETAIVEVGDAPSWALFTPDGRHCVAANTRDDTVSFIANVGAAPRAGATEVARVDVGDGPKHLTAGRVPADVLASWRR